MVMSRSVLEGEPFRPRRRRAGRGCPWRASGRQSGPRFSSASRSYFRLSSTVSTSRQRPLVPLWMKVSAPPSQNTPPSGAALAAFAFIQSKLQCSRIAGQRSAGTSIAEEVGDPPDLAFHVGLEVGEVHEQHVRQMPDVPPRADVLPERPERMAVLVEPVVVVLSGPTPDGRQDRVADPAGRVVQRAVPRRVGVGVVVPHAPQHVAAVAGDVDVLGLRREHERVDRQVGLQEAPVGLRRDRRQLHLARRHPQVDPGRHLRDVDVRRRRRRSAGRRSAASRWCRTWRRCRSRCRRRGSRSRSTSSS